MIPTPFLYNATVVSVHDGDTIYVVVDRGMYDYTGSEKKPVPIRLDGAAARELADPGGKDARDFVAHLLPEGTPLVLETVKPDKYAPRWRARVRFILDGREQDLTDYLIHEGWAVAWNGTGTQPKPAWPRVPMPMAA